MSELIQIKIEHVELGYFDLYSKGGKLRRLYIPKKLKNETLAWLEDTERTSGYEDVCANEVCCNTTCNAYKLFQEQ